MIFWNKDELMHRHRHVEQILSLPPHVLLRKVRNKVKSHLKQVAVRFSARWLGTEISDTAFLRALDNRFSTIQGLLDHLSTGEGHRFFLERVRCEELVEAIRTFCPNAEPLTISAADTVCEYIFDLLGSGPTHVGDKIDWHVDFKTGHRWNPKTYYKRIRPAPYPGGYDIKVPWELSRCQHFVRLGQAYWITDDKKYAQEFVAQVEDWIESNPWPWGVNWACTMDVAIRVVNWLWGYHFFKESSSLSDEFCLSFYKSLFIHGRHIRGNLENLGEITTNHYISDLVGLIYLGILCPEFDEASEWREFGLRELWREIFKQVLPDGVDYEGSIAYHRLVTELLVSVVILCRLNDILVPDTVMARLEKMLEFVMWYTKPDGSVPLIGDADNGRLYRLKTWDQPEREWIDHRYLLAIGAVLYDRDDFAQAAGDQWEEAIWLCAQLTPGIDGLLPQVCFHKVEALSQFTCAGYKDGGFHIIKNEQMFLIVRGGGIGTAGMGNHTHNDALSFEWSFNHTTLIRDSGTGVYTADYNMRNMQRSVRSHSTICVDGCEPCNLSARRPFSLSGKRLVAGEVRALSDEYVAQCDLTMLGYQGLPQGDVIRRTIRVGQEGTHLYIVDGVQGSGKHIVERFFVLGDALQVTVSGLVATCPFSAGNLKIEFISSCECRVWTEKIWRSDSYGCIAEGYVVRCREEVDLPFQTETHLRFVRD